MIEGHKIAEARVRLAADLRERVRQLALEFGLGDENDDGISDEEALARMQLASDMLHLASRINTTHPEQPLMKGPVRQHG